MSPAAVPGDARLRLAAGLCVALAAAGEPALAGDLAEQTQALAERAAAHVQAVGPGPAFASFTRADGGFISGDLYVFCVDATGTILAHGGNPKLVGKKLSATRDSEGIALNSSFNHVGFEHGKGWVEYIWPNPQTFRIQRKLAYILGVNDHVICGSGYFPESLP